MTEDCARSQRWARVGFLLKVYSRCLRYSCRLRSTVKNGLTSCCRRPSRISSRDHPRVILTSWLDLISLSILLHSSISSSLSISYSGHAYSSTCIPCHLYFHCLSFIRTIPPVVCSVSFGLPVRTCRTQHSLSAAQLNPRLSTIHVTVGFISRSQHLTL